MVTAPSLRAGVIPALAAVVVAAACGPRSPSARAPVAATASTSEVAATPSASPTPSSSASSLPPPTDVALPALPTGWAWPFDPARAPDVLKGPGVPRPFDLASIAAIAAKGGACRPIQVAPRVWTSPICNSDRPRLGRRKGQKSASFAPDRELPSAVDLRSYGWDGPVMDQQMVGVCWTFALANAMTNGLRRAQRSEVVSPMHVLASTTWDDLWAGRRPPPLVTEPAWSYDPVKACKLNESKSEVWCKDAYHVEPGSWREDAALSAERARASENGVFRAASFASLKLDRDFPDRVVATIANGQAVVVGFKIDPVIWDYSHVSKGFVADWTNGTAGHDVTLVAYRAGAAGREFLVHNSWGTGWGDNGYAWLSEAMLTRFADDAYVLDAIEATRGAPVPAPSKLPPAPIPTPPPTSAPVPAPPSPTSTCAPGQARDLVFGACASACGDGSPPVAGLCVASPKAPLPMPAPTTPAPTPGVCASGEVRDWLTGKCAKQCTNGLPPAAGVCAP